MRPVSGLQLSEVPFPSLQTLRFITEDMCWSHDFIGLQSRNDTSSDTGLLPMINMSPDSPRIDLGLNCNSAAIPHSEPGHP